MNDLGRVLQAARWVAVAAVGVGVVGAGVVTAARLVGWDTGTPLAQAVAFVPVAAVATVVLLVAALALRARRLAIGCAVVVAVQACLVVPHVVGSSSTAPAGHVMRVLAVNAYLGRADPDAVVSLVRERRADVLMVVELSPGLRDEIGRALAASHPHQVTRPGKGADGAGIWSVRALQEAPPPQGTTFAGVAARTTVGSASVALVPVHTYPPMPLGVPAWQADIERYARYVRGIPGPVVAAGDFNATQDHSDFRAYLREAAAVDAAATAGRALVPTWPARFPVVTLDHVTVAGGATTSEYAVHPIAGSDHLAVSATVTVPSG